jgi:hypothetical protein
METSRDGALVQWGEGGVCQDVKTEVGWSKGLPRVQLRPQHAGKQEWERIPHFSLVALFFGYEGVFILRERPTQGPSPTLGPEIPICTEIHQMRVGAAGVQYWRWRG